MVPKEIKELLDFFPCPCVKGNKWFSYITLGKTYCQLSRKLSVSETSLYCGLVVHINLVIACFVQASDDWLLKMKIDHHNQQLLRLINRLQWSLSKPISIRTKEKYRFRQVIGLDRFTFTALGKIEICTLQKAWIIWIITLFFFVVWTFIASAIILLSI